jgi:hypothetical protein
VRHSELKEKMQAVATLPGTFYQVLSSISRGVVATFALQEQLRHLLELFPGWRCLSIELRHFQGHNDSYSYGIFKGTRTLYLRKACLRKSINQVPVHISNTFHEAF